eukprot:scaffold27097_cov26-Attheya_sp.AAC.2
MHVIYNWRGRTTPPTAARLPLGKEGQTYRRWIECNNRAINSVVRPSVVFFCCAKGTHQITTD